MTPEPSLVPGRAPRYAPLTERDEAVLSVADWLADEGYCSAAEALKVSVNRHQMMSLEEVRDSGCALDMLAYCHIWSGEHLCYWRPNGAGYTTSALDAGIYTLEDALRRTAHCDPSKEISFEVLPYRPAQQSGWKS